MIQNVTINNKQYNLLFELGKGAAGKVYKAQYQNQFYAIKKQEYFGEGELEFYGQLVQQNFKKCKNLIQIYDFQQIGRFSYVVMELGDFSLYDALEQNKIDQKNIRYIIKQIASGIKELHEMGLAHRDLKPENILIQTIFSEQQSQQVYKICDFGVVKNTQKLVTKQVGTPYYLAPEVISNNKNSYSKECDIWSFGVLIYEILTKKLMFQGKTINDITNAILNITDNGIEMLINQLYIEPDYRELLKNMLKVDAQKRYNIDQVLESLKPKSRSTSRQRQNHFVQQFPPPNSFSIRGNPETRNIQTSFSPLQNIQNQNTTSQIPPIQNPQQKQFNQKQNVQQLKQLNF
ncbi:unnamed protein product (macronuclear) [Paramecium tetraurelia]|uniref:Protein kinase domain-containing protein n=1 Tax=Paramecium tetraurelia TaxID=5888 RepID=A0DYV9_PARTE|nr:uncharacterized protein GSPATT00003194001 [Paramecium tetraurelia]CAK88226.1 unnamed protein product [Paramecium tetraurelia]|eukprot:XP_001455623.1 hypothetical protein (macronuclear) [Paramecium tetraurelia strain d4-2]